MTRTNSISHFFQSYQFPSWKEVRDPFAESALIFILSLFVARFRKTRRLTLPLRTYAYSNVITAYAVTWINKNEWIDPQKRKELLCPSYKTFHLIKKVMWGLELATLPLCFNARYRKICILFICGPVIWNQLTCDIETR